MADKFEVAKILMLMTRLPNSPLDNDPAHIEQAVELYYLVLKDLDTAHLQAAAAQFLSTGTFFPTPGQLRRTAMELRLSARGIPTAAEAWADVQSAVRHVEAHYCPVGWRLREQAIRAQEAHDGAGYILGLNQYIDHYDRCGACRGVRTEEVYCHPVVEQTVRRLGGRAALFTDNLAADRARFIEAYEEILGKAVMEAGRLPEVANWLESDRNADVKRLR